MNQHPKTPTTSISPSNPRLKQHIKAHKLFNNIQPTLINKITKLINNLLPSIIIITLIIAVVIKNWILNY